MAKNIVNKIFRSGDREIIGLIIFFTFLYSVWSINRHVHFQTDAVDLGIFDQVIWKYSHFQIPLSTVKFGTYPGANILGDHFHPLIAILAPLYWLWGNVSMILIAQAVLVGIGAWPIYQLALDKFKNKYFSLSLAFAYLGFIGIQTLIDYDFHEIAFGLPILAFAFLYLHRKDYQKYFIFIVLAIFVKEDLPLYVAMLGLYSIIRLRQYKVGLITMAIGLVSYFTITTWIIPYFKRDIFAYEHLPPEIGKTGLDLIKTAVTNPFLVARAAFYDGDHIKIKTSFNLLGSFGFLPLLSPTTLLLTLPNITERFLTTLMQRWIIRFQYSAILSPIFALATIHAVQNLQWVGKKLKLAKQAQAYLLPSISILLVLSTLYFTYRDQGPLLRMVNPKSYQLSPQLQKNYEVLKKIPANASVGAQSSWVPHLSHRQEIYSYEPTLLERVQPDYLVLTNLETSDSFYKYKQLEEMKEVIRQRADYQILVDDGVRLLAKKKTIS